MEVDKNDNTDDDYEEEEFLVYLDFQSKIKSEALGKQNIKIKMIGLETDEPIVQVNNKIFRGVFEHAMGTNIFFTPDENPPAMDSNFESIPSTMYKYHSQTDKVLKMERIFIKPKHDNNEEENEKSIEEQTDDEDNDCVPNESYSDALNLFLSPGELPPRTLSGSDVIKPVEFQAFFRPRLNESANLERDEENIDSMQTNDNCDKDVADASEECDGIEPTAAVKIETIKEEEL